jgi:hydroxymethylbilane synthase
VAAVDHGPTRRAVEAERAYLAELGGGCDLPVAAYARAGPDGSLHLDALLASLDGRVVLRTGDDGPDPADLGRALARRLLEEAGGAWLLESLRGGPAPAGRPS